MKILTNTTLKKIVDKYFFIPNIVLVLLSAFVLRIIISPLGTLTLDQNTFIAWSNILAEDGFSNFYKGWSDYFPGYLYVLWLLNKISFLTNIGQDTLYKLPAVLGDLGIGFLIYKIVNKLIGEKLGIISASLYLFNPATFANSTLWGQVDSIPALFSLLSIWLVNTNPILSSVLFGLGVSIKPQVAFILPALVFVMFREKWRITRILFYGGVSFFLVILLFLPFNNLPSFINFIIERVSISFNQYPYTSVNAFNFWGIFGLWQKDNLIFSTLGILVYLSTLGFLFFRIRSWSTEEAKYALTGVALLASYLFFTRMHERHLLLALPSLIIMFSYLPWIIIPLVGFSIIYVINLYYAFNWITYDFVQVIPEILIKFLSVFGVFLFVCLLFLIIKGKKITPGFFQVITWFMKGRHVESTNYKFPKLELSKKTIRILLGVVLLVSLLSKTILLGSPENEYFDEVYHAFTARTMLHGDIKAWEWWNTPPEGFAYEWTHPPLAKLGMVLGMLVFGENSFGWRIPGALLGTGVVLLIYLISKEIFKDDILGILAAGAFSLDGLTLVSSRIGMNDTYHLFFILLALLLFMKDKNFFSSVAFGLALSSKWSAIWAIPIFLLIWLSQKRKWTWGYFSFIVVPPLIYVGSYIPMFLQEHGLDIFWGIQKQMWWYHTRLRASHPYTSPWWTWPLLVRPIYLYTSEEIGGFVSRIYAFGNPVVFWGGLISIFFAGALSFIEKNKKLWLVIFGYLVFFVPWAASPRIMFIYHYLPSLPFLAIATGYILRRYPKLIVWSFGLAVLAFVYFYPHWAGLSIPLWLDKSYYWFNSWR